MSSGTRLGTNFMSGGSGTSFEAPSEMITGMDKGNDADVVNA